MDMDQAVGWDVCPSILLRRAAALGKCQVRQVRYGTSSPSHIYIEGTACSSCPLCSSSLLSSSSSSETLLLDIGLPSGLPLTLPS